MAGLCIAILCGAAAADDSPPRAEPPWPAGVPSAAPTDPWAPDAAPEPLWPGPATAGRPYWRRNLFKRFASDQKFAATTWWAGEGRRLSFALPMLASVVAASGSSASGFDLRWERSIEQWGSRGNGRAVATAFTRLGDGEVALVVIGSTHLLARWTGHDRMAEATSLSAEALLNSALYSGLLKRVTRRARPSGSTGTFFTEGPARGRDVDSFPSGHAMGAFAVASVFSSQYRDRRWVPWVAYGTASLIAGSRLALGRHFPSDVAAGAMLGRSVGKMVMTRAGAIEPRGFATHLEPLFDPDGGGVGLAYRLAW